MTIKHTEKVEVVLPAQPRKVYLVLKTGSRPPARATRRAPILQVRSGQGNSV